MAGTFYKGETASLAGCTGFSLTGMTTKKVVILRPDATSVQYTGASVVVDDAITGQWHVVAAAGDLNQAGLYLRQSYWSDGSVIRYGPLDTFLVEDPLVFS